ncbi:MAG: ABC transporter permease [Candidatus Kariarchaeaceae archaeon]|jgi:peptide/nickel transport system permease protein
MRFGLYFILRVWGLLLQLFGGLVLIFFLFNIIPYDPVGVFLFNFAPSSDAERELLVQSLRAQWGLDKPLLAQVGSFLTELVQTGSLGESWYGGSVNDLLKENLIFSLFMLIMVTIAYIPLSILLGVSTARRNRRFYDFLVRVITSIFYGVPYYIIAVLVLTFGQVEFSGDPSSFFSYFPEIFIPVGITILVYTSFQYRLVRSELRLILRKNYIRTAYAKGLSDRAVIYRHAIRNALPPIVLSFTITIPLTISTLAVLEYLFGFPGIGNLLVDAARNLDWGVIIGISAVFLFINSVLTFVADVVVQLVTPERS